MKDNSRREFIKKTAMGSAALAVTSMGFNAKSYGRIMGANDRVNCAMIGAKRRFGALGPSLSKVKDTDMTYICDIDKKQLEKGAKTIKDLTGSAPKTEKDLRKVLEDKDVDAVFIAIPDHWHACATWLSLEAGKHVYVEKPCSHNPAESELMVALQVKYGKVVQMGNQQRSAPESQEIIGEIHNGVIGDTYLAKAFYTNNRGRVDDAKTVNPPEWFDWDLFQGPAPRKEFKNILEDYVWHWFWHWGTAETGNNATHELDVARWALQVEHPELVHIDAGKRHFVDDPWEMYDTMTATYQFANGRTIIWDGKSRNNYDTYGGGRGTVIYGSEGSVYVDRGGYRLYDRGGKLLKERKSSGEEGSVGLGGGGDMTTLHVQNFIDSVRGNAKPNSHIKEGALSSNLAHYPNIAYRAGKNVLMVDPWNGRLKDKKVHKEFWGREYEPGWEPPKV